MSHILTHTGTVIFPAQGSRSNLLWTYLGQKAITTPPVFTPTLAENTEVFIDYTQGKARLDPAVVGTTFDVSFDYDSDLSDDAHAAMLQTVAQKDIDLLTVHAPKMDDIIAGTTLADQAVKDLAAAFKDALVSWKQVNI